MKAGDKVQVMDNQAFLYKATGTVIEIKGERVLIQCTNLRRWFTTLQLKLIERMDK